MPGTIFHSEDSAMKKKDEVSAFMLLKFHSRGW